MKISPWDPEYRRLSVGIVALVSVFGFEGIAIGAVMPVAAADLNAISNYAVAFTSFTMASLLGMTFAGLWANKIGLARVVIFAVVALALGSLVAGFASNLSVLTLGRSIQGFALGIDLVQFGVVVILNFMIAMITPPYGLILFVLGSLTGVPMKEINREIWQFCIPLSMVMFGCSSRKRSRLAFDKETSMFTGLFCTATGISTASATAPA